MNRDIAPEYPAGTRADQGQDASRRRGAGGRSRKRARDRNHRRLPPQPGKRSDSRSARFELEHGRLVQVELDALSPDDLRAIYEEALATVWDVSRYDEVLEREADERREL
jgi:hypothetical protein